MIAELEEPLTLFSTFAAYNSEDNNIALLFLADSGSKKQDNGLLG